MKIRRKTAIFEAFQLEVRALNWPDWAHDALTENKIISHNTGKWASPSEETYLMVNTPHGLLKASLGDYVIKTPVGIYVLGPKLFDLYYEEAKE
jgi:hypothetical protein